MCLTNRLPNSTDYASTNSVTLLRVNNAWQPNELLDAVMDQPLKNVSTIEDTNVFAGPQSIVMGWE